MARNKYPEETIKKILDVSQQLFMTKGYEKTSIQDIVDRLGMSKGAIYHHFKSKEDILERLCGTYYDDDSWYESIQRDAGLNGLQKLEKLFSLQLGEEKKISMDAMAGSALYNSRMVLETLKQNLQEAVPYIARLIEEGNRDGSLHVEYPMETAEIILVLANLWINPCIFSVDKTHFLQKGHCYQQMLYGLGIPLVWKDLQVLLERYYDGLMYYRDRNEQSTHASGREEN